VVKAGLAKRCQIQLAYAIGVAEPVSVLVMVDKGDGILRHDEKLAAICSRVFDARPAAIIEQLDLRRPIYRQTAAYGHFGRNDLDLPWEKTDKVEELLKLV